MKNSNGDEERDTLSPSIETYFPDDSTWTVYEVPSGLYVMVKVAAWSCDVNSKLESRKLDEASKNADRIWYFGSGNIACSKITKRRVRSASLLEGTGDATRVGWDKRSDWPCVFGTPSPSPPEPVSWNTRNRPSVSIPRTERWPLSVSSAVVGVCSP